MNKKFGKHLTTILKEMCHRVGAKSNKIDFKKEGWFCKYTWTEKEQDDFTDWLTKYLYNNHKARIDLMTITSKIKRYCKEAADMFVFNYGWKLKDEKKD